ncbi:hypothetical protein CT0861_03817 [Colletotrichum tofieldiae]|uniref:Uncharacterized protein n=1 Tax=Colletotrichum tofieldiae TaxID=708197 RepID=A0A166MED5_9PEZI|nr:hypothetical protein CT0861_03817 [Colletotrichum tofieldiae]
MAAHAEHGPVAVTFAERVFQQLEDNRPSEAPVDFSDPLSNTSTPVKSKATETLSQPARGNTMGSANFYAQSKTGKSTLPRNGGSMGISHVQQLVASYEVRSCRTEGLALKTARRKSKASAAEHLSPQENTPSEWTQVIDADLD